jgi:hypothetical protein
MPSLGGTPSDHVPEILSTGRSGVTTMFVSMSARHLEGRDADYIRWHTLDHRPEQYRLASLRSSQRLISTPACRAARATTSSRYDAIDHLMSYLFADRGDLGGFVELSDGLRNAGRTPELLPLVERGVYRPAGMAAAPRIKVGADVLPWWPVRGVYVMIEEGAHSAEALTDVSGVGGAWWFAGDPENSHDTSADTRGLQLTYLYLDDDPLAVAKEITAELEKRWSSGDTTPLFASPFYAVTPYDWDRYLP